MSATSRRIALFLDGTWNVEGNNTNVWRLKALCQIDGSQVSYYSQGVGTKFGERISGGMLGWGLEEEIIDAYEWLVENFAPGDEIFIFGFSRGAYTARSLSGLISECGLLQLGAPLGVGELFARYRQANGLRSIRQLHSALSDSSSAFTQEERWMLKYSAPVPIKFIGVWDTVGSLGIPFGNTPISRRSFRFLQTDLRINNDNAYHALAIDEHRKAFAPTLWTRTVRQDAKPGDVFPPRDIKKVEQRWFIGAHANIGGGYDSDLLAQIPLDWMMKKAEAHGLTFRGAVSLDGREGGAPIADSYAAFMGGVYRFVSCRYYRPIGRSPWSKTQETMTNNINETIDASVFDRWRKDPAYRPRNLEAWARSKRIDPGKLECSVRADNPTVEA